MEEQGKLKGWRLGMSIQSFRGIGLCTNINQSSDELSEENDQIESIPFMLYGESINSLVGCSEYRFAYDYLSALY